MADAARPGDEPAQPREAFARRWAAAIAPGTPPDDPLEHVLAGLVDDLRAAVRPDEGDGGEEDPAQHRAADPGVAHPGGVAAHRLVDVDAQRRIVGLRDLRNRRPREGAAPRALVGRQELRLAVELAHRAGVPKDALVFAPGGPDMGLSQIDRGAGDELHGESGNSTSNDAAESDEYDVDPETHRRLANRFDGNLASLEAGP